MNLFRKRPYGAALFLGTAFLFAACEKPEQRIGLEVQPEDDLLNVYVTDTLSLDVFTLNEDSLKTDELSLSLAGNYMDPMLGLSRASFYSHIRLSTNNVDFGNIADLVVDSIVLSLVYEGEVYGNLNDQEWSVKELSEQLYVDSAYFSNREMLVGDELIKPGFSVQPTDPESYILLSETDSILPQLRLRLDESLAQRFIDASGSTDLSNNTNFVSFFKGIYVSSLSDDAGIVRFDVLHPESRVRMYYRNVVEEDTLTFDFNLNADCARFTRYQHDYNGTALQGVDEEPVSGSDLCYIQAGAGVKTRITFPGLMDLNEFNGRTINKAELILPVGSMDTEAFEPPSTLFALTRNAEGNDIGIPDQVLGVTHIGGIYDDTEMNYRFNITRFLQSVLDGTQDTGELYIVSSSGGVSSRRVVINGPENPGENLRLVLTFSN